MHRHLLSPDPGDGGGALSPTVPQPAVTTNDGASPTAGPTSTPAAVSPPAGRIVVSATRTEREVELQSELEQERSAHASTAAEKKERELRIMQLEDELRTLKTAAVPAHPGSSRGSWTFFD
jgi:hypothetical protein